MKIADFLWPRSIAAEGLGSIALFDTRPRSAESLAARLRQHYPVLRVAIRDNDPAGLDLAARKSQKGRLGTRAASAAHARVRPRPQRGLNSADPVSSATASLFSATTWSSGRLDAYLGISASPANPIVAYLSSTQDLDPNATGFYLMRVRGRHNLPPPRQPVRGAGDRAGAAA